MGCIVRRPLGFSLLEPMIALMVCSLFCTVIWQCWSNSLYHQYIVAQKSQVLQWAQTHYTQQFLLFYQGQSLTSASGHWQGLQQQTIYWQQTITERADHFVELQLDIHWQTERGQEYHIDIHTGVSHLTQDVAPLSWIANRQ